MQVMLFRGTAICQEARNHKNISIACSVKSSKLLSWPGCECDEGVRVVFEWRSRDDLYRETCSKNVQGLRVGT